jgi:pimeloyl-ACP methyl ester carboxylesterase
VGRAVVYEPPLLVPALLPSASFTATLHADLAAGQPDAVVEAFFRRIEGLNDRQLAKLRGMRAWAMRVASAPTIPRELEGVRHYELQETGLRAWARPVLLLVGGLSPSPMREASDKVASCLRSARTELLPGQRHGAMNSAPALFVDAVLAFLDASG